MSCYSAREPATRSFVPTCLGTNVRVRLRDRHPRCPGSIAGRRNRNGTPPSARRAMARSSRPGAGDGRAHRRTEPGRPYQVPACISPGRPRGGPARDTLSRMPRPHARFAFLLVVVFGLGACSEAAAPSFDPTGACVADGSAPGAYPDLEAFVPTSYRDGPPESVDSGRNCSPASLGVLADRGFQEVRFAGGTWTFGAERAIVLAVFSAANLDGRRDRGLLRGQRPGGQPNRGHRRIADIDCRTHGATARHQDGRAVADRDRLAVVQAGPGQRHRHQRLAGSPNHRCHRSLRRPMIEQPANPAGSAHRTAGC